jgi:hypothetical protein
VIKRPCCNKRNRVNYDIITVNFQRDKAIIGNILSSTLLVKVKLKAKRAAVKLPYK